MAAATSGRDRGRSLVARGCSTLRVLAPFYAANTLTLARLAAAPLIVVLLLTGRAEAAFWIFTVAAVSDAFDGLVAKWFNGESRLGRVLDPIADKLLVGSTVLTLAALALTPAWLAALIIARDVAIAVGTAAVRSRAGFRVEPLLVGKASTVVQLVYIGAVIGSMAGFAAGPPLVEFALPAAVVVTLASAAAYLGVLVLGTGGSAGQR